MAEAVAKDGSQKAQPEGSAECGAWSGRSWCDCGVQVNTTTHKGASVPLPVPGLCPARPQSGPQPCLGQSSPSPSWGGLCRASCPSTAVCCVEGTSLWSAACVAHHTSPTSCGLRQCNGSQIGSSVSGNNGLAAPGMAPSTEKGGAWLWQQSARECEAELSVQFSMSQGLQWPSEASVDGKQSCTKLQGKVSESDQSKPCPAQGCACLWLRTGVSAGPTGQ